MIDWQRVAREMEAADAMVVAKAEYYARPRRPVLSASIHGPVEPYTLEEIEARMKELEEAGWPTG